MSPYRVTVPAPREVWAQLLGEDPLAQAFQSPAWLDSVVEASGGRDASRLYELADGRRLVMPLVAGGGGRPPVLSASLPHGWGCGGLLGGAQPVSSSDVAAVLPDLLHGRPLRLVLRPPSRDAAAHEAVVPTSIPRTRHREQVLDLSGGFGTVWTERFSGKARRAVRKAEASVLTVGSGGAELLPEFRALYRESVARWARRSNEPLALARLRAARREPDRKFDAVARRLGPGFRVWLARVDGRPAAAILVLVQGRTATYWRGAMDLDLAGPVRANDLLHRLAIEDACLAGCSTYALGDSGSSDSLRRFKESFGAVSRDYCGYVFERLPMTAWDEAARRAVKRVVRFREP